MLRLLLLSCLCIANTFAVRTETVERFKARLTSNTPEDREWRDALYTRARNTLANYEQSGTLPLLQFRRHELIEMASWLCANLQDNNKALIRTAKLLTLNFYRVDFILGMFRVQTEQQNTYRRIRERLPNVPVAVPDIRTISDLTQFTHFTIINAFYPELFSDFEIEQHRPVALDRNTAASRIAEIGNEYLKFAKREPRRGVSFHCAERAIHYYS